MIKNRKAFIVGIKSTILTRKEKLFLKKYRPWGVILFTRNLKNFNQIKKLTNNIKLIFIIMSGFLCFSIALVFCDNFFANS